MNSTNSPTQRPTNATKSPTSFDYYEPLKWDGHLVIALLVIGFASMIMGWSEPDITFFGMVAILILANVITVNEGISGFSQTGVMTVCILYVVAGGLTATGAMGYFVGKLLGIPKTIARAHIKFSFAIVATKLFINNTPIFMLFIPVVQTWSAKIKVPVKQFYMVLSFVLMLGGTVALTGTSTNLVVTGRANVRWPKVETSLFTQSPAGVPVLFIGLAYIFLFAERLVPLGAGRGRGQRLGDESRRSGSVVGNEVKQSGWRSNISSKIDALLERFGTHRQTESKTQSGFTLDSMTFSALIPETSIIVGKSIAEANLRKLENLFLVAVARDQKTFHAVGPEFLLEANDVLSFSGNGDKFVSVCSDLNLVPWVDGKPIGEASMDTGKVSGNISALLVTNTIMVIVPAASTIVGKTAKECQFRSLFGASILSIFRAGKKLDAPIGQTVFNVGDVLCLLPDGSSNFTFGEDLKILSNSKTSSEGIPYLIGAKVLAKSRLQLTRSISGLSVEKAGLRGLPGIFLIAVEKQNGEIVRSVAPNFVLSVNDICWFSGEAKGIEVLRLIPGLELIGETQAKKIGVRPELRRLIEVVISPTSSMIGSTVQELRFRSRFNAAIVAIRRQGTVDQFISEKIGQARLLAGDTLILDAGPDFIKGHLKDQNFVVVHEVDKSTPPHFRWFFVSVVICLSMLGIFVGFNTKISLIPLGLCASGLMLMLRILTPQQARDCIDWKVICTIAGAEAFSIGMEKSGLAKAVGASLVQAAIATGTGEVGILTAVYIATALCCQVVSHNASALLMFTIGASAADIYGIPPIKMIVTLMFGASHSFASPYSYQTNMMANALGDYTFSDFIVFGGPLQLLMIPVSVIAAYYYYEGYIFCIISTIVMLLAMVYRWFRGLPIPLDEPTPEEESTEQLALPSFKVAV